MTAMFLPQTLSTTHLLVVLNLVYAANAQIGYRERTRSPARIIAGAIVGGIALLFFVCAFMMFSRRRRAARMVQLGSIPRPHAGEQPYVGPQQYGPPGSPPIINSNGQYIPQGGYAPWQAPYTPGQPSYPSQQGPYLPQQAHYGEKPQEDQLPAYSREKAPEVGTQVRSDTPLSEIHAPNGRLLSSSPVHQRIAPFKRRLQFIPITHRTTSPLLADSELRIARRLNL
ncbi:hypothetical protein FA13DRAFT_1281127 [Coprinellus micaceus]|uniref:Uncharacterized protein n=1 Tax=Coprinellus micaceus TaxID=71717 RepID=A0A4Y7ST62_COPMI|nr:hypothetical protein FA13DRAFT_1281127 [Coprinellus micaceus]